MPSLVVYSDIRFVALFTRAWIEIDIDSVELDENGSRPLHEGVD